MSPPKFTSLGPDHQSPLTHLFSLDLSKHTIKSHYDEPRSPPGPSAATRNLVLRLHQGFKQSVIPSPDIWVARQPVCITTGFSKGFSCYKVSGILSVIRDSVFRQINVRAILGDPIAITNTCTISSQENKQTKQTQAILTLPEVILTLWGIQATHFPSPQISCPRFQCKALAEAA